MRIGFFGDSVWAQNSLLSLLEDSRFEVMFVVPRYNNPDLQLIKIAEKYKIPVIKTDNVNKEDFIRYVESHAIDLNISMSFDQIIKNELIHLAPKGFINCHAGALPFYRGRNVLNWALINGEEQFGITVHYIDQGIDTGDIIIQHMEPINEEDTYSDLLIKCYEICPKILLQAVDAIYEENSIRIAQETIHSVGFYCGKRIEGDERINWNWNSKQIYNFIRGLSHPALYAQTYMNNQKIKIARATFIKDAPVYIGTCGEVVGRNSNGIIVKTGNTTILIEKIVSSEGILLTPRFSVGQRFV